jgi:hypothetical protein
LRDRIFSPGVATGSTNDSAKSSSPGLNGCRLATSTSFAMIVAVPSILAPRTVTPALSSSTTRATRSSACSPQALSRSACGLMIT